MLLILIYLLSFPSRILLFPVAAFQPQQKAVYSHVHQIYPPSLCRPQNLNVNNHRNNNNPTIRFQSVSGGGDRDGTGSSAPIITSITNQIPNRSNYHIMLIDDEESIRTAVGTFLKEQGYQITTYSDAVSAWNVLQKKQPQPQQSIDVDVIVSDVRMPHLDGLEFLKLIRTHPQWQSIPVVLLTAKGMPEHRVSGYRAGADAYIPKPFDPEELVSILDNVIVRYQTRNSNHVDLEALKRDLKDVQRQLQQLKPGRIPTDGGKLRTVTMDGVFLAPDERQILHLLSQGRTNKEIAETCFLSVRRVEQLITAMFRKTVTRNRTELVRWAIATGHVQV
jgi:DNA-binding NarL/FixJ family response regulator